ncbi:hypothetical protein ACEPAH_9655 [Sanghuangporus vaninii]
MPHAREPKQRRRPRKNPYARPKRHQGPYQKKKQYIIPWEEVHLHPDYDPNEVIMRRNDRGSYDPIGTNNYLRPIIPRVATIEVKEEEVEIDLNIKEEEVEVKLEEED